MTYILIDPPVTPFSALSELKDWAETLRGMEQTPEVLQALADVEEWIAEANETAVD